MSPNIPKPENNFNVSKLPKNFSKSKPSDSKRFISNHKCINKLFSQSSFLKNPEIDNNFQLTNQLTKMN